MKPRNVVRSRRRKRLSKKYSEPSSSGGAAPTMSWKKIKAQKGYKPQAQAVKKAALKNAQAKQQNKSGKQQRKAGRKAVADVTYETQTRVGPGESSTKAMRKDWRKRIRGTRGAPAVHGLIRGTRKGYGG